uniref:Uncharacterized protein n=1 Tax=Arundo donax TaxID=35708 RepID=A0A0A9QSR7_ARUDO
MNCRSLETICLSDPSTLPCKSCRIEAWENLFGSLQGSTSIYVFEKSTEYAVQNAKSEHMKASLAILLKL